MENILKDKAFFELCKDTADLSIKTKDPEGAKFSSTEIRSKFFEFLGVADVKDPKFGARFQMCQKEMFGLVIETITEIMPNFYNSEFMRRFVDYRTFGFGEKPVFEVEDMNLFVVSQVANGTWDTRRQKAYGKTDFVLPYETYDVYVYGELFDFLSGRIDFASLIAKVARSIQFQREQRILASFLALPDMVNPDFLESGSPTQLRVIELAERVGQLTGATPVLCGTKLALFNLIGQKVNDNWATFDMLDEVNETGTIATWNGYAVMPIPTAIKPGTTQIQPNNNKIIVLPEFATSGGNDSKFIKVADAGTPIVRQVAEPQRNQDMTLEYQIQYRSGVGISINHHFGVCDFS